MKLATISRPIALQAISKNYPFGLVSQYIRWRHVSDNVRRRPIKKKLFLGCFSRSHFLLATNFFETPRRNGCSHEKGSFGRDMPSVGMLVGLLLALTRQAASALLELSSSTLSSWCGLCRQPDWAPHRLGACALSPWACSWSLQGHEPNSAASGTSWPSKRVFCRQWLACSDMLACPWWSLEGSLAAP